MTSRLLHAMLAGCSLWICAAPAAAQSFPGGISFPGRSADRPAQPQNQGNLIRDFMMDTQALTNQIDGTTVTEADNARIDEEVAAYRALADRVAGSRYRSLPEAQRAPMMQGLEMHYRNAAMVTPDMVERAMDMIPGTGRADAAYNFLIAHDAYLYAATVLFPRNREFQSAKSQVELALNGLGNSRAGAVAAEEEAELAAAQNVRMPPAVTNDPAAENMFRQAWQTSGIDWEIMQINVTSGWRDKVENGRVVGQRRDAAIAARDPNNPERCNLYDFTLLRDRSGNIRRDSSNTTRIACENVR